MSFPTPPQTLLGSTDEQDHHTPAQAAAGLFKREGRSATRMPVGPSSDLPSVMRVARVASDNRTDSSDLLRFHSDDNPSKAPPCPFGVYISSYVQALRFAGELGRACASTVHGASPTAGFGRRISGPYVAAKVAHPFARRDRRAQPWAISLEFPGHPPPDLIMDKSSGFICGSG